MDFELFVPLTIIFSCLGIMYSLVFWGANREKEEKALKRQHEVEDREWELRKQCIDRESNHNEEIDRLRKEIEELKTQLNTERK